MQQVQLEVWRTDQARRERDHAREERDVALDVLRRKEELLHDARERVEHLEHLSAQYRRVIYGMLSLLSDLGTSRFNIPEFLE